MAPAVTYYRAHFPESAMRNKRSVTNVFLRGMTLTILGVGLCAAEAASAQVVEEYNPPRANCCLLNTARTLAEHVGQLSALAAGSVMRPNRPFVERFIRPRGLATPATPVFVETVEALGAEGPVPVRRTPLWVYALRPLVLALVIAGRVPWLERMYWNPAKFRQLANA